MLFQLKCVPGKKVQNVLLSEVYQIPEALTFSALWACENFLSDPGKFLALFLSFTGALGVSAIAPPNTTPLHDPVSQTNEFNIFYIQ